MDKILKFGLIILALIFLLLYYQNSQIGRFQYIKPDDDNIVFAIVDTKTGIAYMAYMLGSSDEEKQLKWMVLDPVNGTVTENENKQR